MSCSWHKGLVNQVSETLRSPSLQYISNNQDITWNYTAPNNGHHQDYYIFSRESLSTFISDSY